MIEPREPKRVRQACQNCRRKKTRCSGEKPVCSFCARLKQDCCWDDILSTCNHPHVASASNDDINLAARVALLESKLSLLNGGGADSSFSLVDSGDVPSKRRRTSIPQHGSVTSDRSGDSQTASESSRKPAKLPPEPVILSILQTYFRHCHNQPYAYFRPGYFYWKFGSGDLPEFLLMAMLALALRFAPTNPYFEGRELEFIDGYARAAWTEIFDKSFSEDFVLDVHAVQATNMLAVVDFTAGRPKLGWQKIGLSVRFAQSLQLGVDSPAHLTAEEQEERLLTFWSVYILDRLVSCSTYHPPTISDGDCNAPLPSDTPSNSENPTTDTTDGSPAVRPTLPDLRVLEDVSGDAAANLDYFAQTVLMASVLGRVQRHIIIHQSSNDPFPPWDSRSEFAAIYSTLLNFEAQSDISSRQQSFADALDRYVVDGDDPSDEPSRDFATAGHLVFANVLYHMNQCLLHHPFLLRKRLDSCKTKISPSFYREGLRRSLEHAYQLTMTLRTVQRANFTFTSFYAYAMCVAGTIHKLFMHHDDEWTSRTAGQLFGYVAEFLDAGQGNWGHYSRTATALRAFQPRPLSAKALVMSGGGGGEYVHDPGLDVMWSLLDYSWLSDARRPSTANHTPQDWPFTTTGTDPHVGTAPTANPMLDRPEDNFAVEDVDVDVEVDKPLATHEEMVALDFLSFPETMLADPWPDTGLDGGDFFSSTADFGQSTSPWTYRPLI